MATATISPAADAGLAGVGGGDADLGALLSQGWDAAADAEGIDAGQEPAPEGAELTPAVTEEPTPDAQPEPVADATGQPEAIDSQYQLTPDGKAYIVPKAQLPGFQTAKKFADAVGQYYSTPQEAQTCYFQANDQRMMTGDFQSGQPEAIQGFLDHWANGGANATPLQQQRHQAAFSKMAELVLPMLQKINPQAYEATVSGTIAKAIDLAYEKAARSNNPDDFKRAQELDWGATGQYKKELPQPSTQQAQLTREQQFEQRQTAAYNRDVSSFNQTGVEGPKFGKLSEAIDTRLAKVKAAYEPQAYADLKTGIHRDIIDKMQGKGPDPDPTAADWWREHVQTWNGIIQDYKTTWEQGQPGANLQARIQSYQQSFVNRANRYLPAVATARIGPATRAQVNRTNSGQFSGKQPQARQQSAPNAQPANGQPKPSRSETWDNEWAQMFKTV